MPGGVRQVEQRPHPAYAEERRDHALPGVQPATLRRERHQAQRADQRADEHDQRHPGENTAPVEGVEQPSAHRHAEAEQHEQGEQALEPLDDSVHLLVVVVAALGVADGHPTGEHRDEAVGTDHLRRAERDRQRCEGQQRLTPLGQAKRFPPGAERQLRQQPPDQRADEEPEHDLADQVPRNPLDDPRARGALRGQVDRGVHEREGQPVVETGLRGEREPDLVPFVASSVRPPARPQGRRPRRHPAHPPARHLRAPGRWVPAPRPAATRSPDRGRGPTSPAATPPRCSRASPPAAAARSPPSAASRSVGRAAAAGRGPARPPSARAVRRTG